jgi:hypothetical protein
MWMAGGGVKRGLSYGETDDYCYNVVSNPVHVHDLQATVLHCLGIDHLKPTYKIPGAAFQAHRRERGSCEGCTGIG